MRSIHENTTQRQNRGQHVDCQICLVKCLKAAYLNCDMLEGNALFFKVIDDLSSSKKVKLLDVTFLQSSKSVMVKDNVLVCSRSLYPSTQVQWWGTDVAQHLEMVSIMFHFGHKQIFEITRFFLGG